jgi:flagellar assembly protein FliH
LSNLFKSGRIVCTNSEKKVIDYNALISEKIQKIQEEVAKKHPVQAGNEFVEGIDEASVSRLLGDNEEQNAGLETVRQQADSIIALASNDAKAIIERANRDAQMIRIDSANVGKQEGYAEGKRLAEAELLALKNEIEEERVRMEIEYNERIQEMEPLLVDTILNVFEKVTHVLASDQKDLVVQLVNDVLAKTEVGREFIVRVSPQDYPYVIDNREMITGVVSKRVHIEIVEDQTFSKGQCLIESDSGIYDCSLDIQMENLIRAIRVMSCMVED